MDRDQEIRRKVRGLTGEIRKSAILSLLTHPSSNLPSLSFQPRRKWKGRRGEKVRVEGIYSIPLMIRVTPEQYLLLRDESKPLGKRGISRLIRMKLFGE